MVDPRFIYDVFSTVAILVICTTVILQSTNLGRNSANFVSAIYASLLARLQTTEVGLWDKSLRELRKKLTKNDFDKLKNIGVTIPEKRADIASNVAFWKISDLIKASKQRPHGHVINMGAGKGGWNQYVAGLPGVKSVTSMTFGKSPATLGHEDYAPINYKGKEKVEERYGDIREWRPSYADWILFDAGELRSTVDEEVKDTVSFFSRAILPWLKCNPTAGFIIRIHNACHPDVQACMLEVQRITGRGSLYRSSYSKSSTTELYLISSKATNLRSNARNLYLHILNNVARLAPSSKKSADSSPPKMEVRSKGFRLLSPLDMSASVNQLGIPIVRVGNGFRHWVSKGIFAFGSRGTAASTYNQWVAKILGPLITLIPGLKYWKATDTTAKGFEGVFKKKIDTAPKEDTIYDDGISRLYDGMADYFISKGFVYKELSKEELYLRMNKSGTSSVIEDHANVREFLNQPDWYEQVQAVRAALLSGRPTHGIFTGIGKREKKKIVVGTKGSRMVAFLPVVMRALEQQIFSCFLDLTHKEWNKFGVGGLGLHDLGERINETWRGFGVSDDIAGFDTRVGLRRLSDEARMMYALSGGSPVIWNMYRLYGYPFVLVPTIAKGLKDVVRSELLSGIGQRMSGTGPTYWGNTITRIILVFACICISKAVPMREWGKQVKVIMEDDTWQGYVSGDDCTVTSTYNNILKFSKVTKELDRMGFPRKDLGKESESDILTSIEEVDFCSHKYTRVSYYDSYSGATVHRYQATREVSEILGKALTWLGTTGEMMDEMAWAGAQGLNLLVNYHHLRTCRSVGLALRSLVPPGLILSDKGKFSIMPRPWMREGDILDIINEVLFGDSTQYPRPGFRVREINHLGVYRYEGIFDRGFYMPERAHWRKSLFFKVTNLVTTFNTGGDTSLLQKEILKFT